MIAYNFELFGGRLHNDVTFALAWGSFPVVVAYVAQSARLGIVVAFAAGASFACSLAQRKLSTSARLLRGYIPPRRASSSRCTV